MHNKCLFGLYSYYPYYLILKILNGKNVCGNYLNIIDVSESSTSIKVWIRVELSADMHCGITSVISGQQCCLMSVKCEMPHIQLVYDYTTNHHWPNYLKTHQAAV